ncbi:hypothetical protein AB0I68_35835 [Streptomyces sp. NPDC050448]|uniref:Rv1733c family protein n=1 Tax=Streptomyces sp. NPDC050448 TaxID=3155404 RepID=UPI00343A9CA8
MRLLWIISAVAIPLAAWLAASAAHGYYAEVRRAQLASRHVVDAKVLADNVNQGGLRSDGARAPAEWHDAAGYHRTVVEAAVGLREGGHLQIWLDGRGCVTAPPIRPSAPVAAGAVVGTGASAGTAAAVFAVRRTLALSLERQRLLAWGRERERVEPRWTGRTV